MVSRTLEVVLAGNSRGAERAFKRVEKGSGLMAKAAKAGAAAAVAATAVIATKGVANAIKFEAQMSEVATLLPEVGEKGFQKLSKDVLAFSDATGVATDQAIPALYQALSAGVPQDNVFTFMEQANKAAVGGVTDLETAVDGLSSVVNAYGEDAYSATQVSDILFTSVRLGKTTFGELGATINQVAPMAAAMNIKLEDAAAAFTAITTAGVPTAQAMTQTRSLMQSLAAPTDSQVKLFRELGIEVNANRLANEGFLPVLQEIIGATAGNEAMQRKLFGTVEALQGALIITGNEGAKYNEIQQAMMNSTGATDAAYNRMTDTVQHKFQVAINRLNNILTKLGMAILPAVTKAIELAVPAIDFLARAVDNLIRIFPRLEMAIRNGLLNAARFIVDWAKGIVETFLGWGESVVNAYNSTIGQLLGKVEVDFEGMRERISTSFGGVISTLESWKGTTVETASEAGMAMQAGGDVIVQAANGMAAGVATAANKVTTDVRAMSNSVVTDTQKAQAAMLHLLGSGIPDGQRTGTFSSGFAGIDRALGGAPTLAKITGGSSGGSSGGAGSSKSTSTKEDDERRAAEDRAKAEGRVERLATSLKLYGGERDRFIGQWMEAWQGDQNLYNSDRLAFYAREETEAQRVQRRWQEQIDGQKQLAKVLENIAKNTKASTEMAAAEAKRQAEARNATALSVVRSASTDNLSSEQVAAYYKALRDSDGGGTAGTHGDLVSYGQQGGERTFVGPDGTTVTLPAGSSTNDAREALGIPQLAGGGIVRARAGGTLVTAGEGGEDEVVAPMSKLMAMLGGQGARTEVVLRVEGSGPLADWVRENVNVSAERGELSLS